MSSPSTPATWSVQSQTPRTRATATGNVEDGYDISFVTGQGHTGVIFVPMAQYRVDTVQAMIQAQANLIDQVGSLTHATQG